MTQKLCNGCSDDEELKTHVFKKHHVSRINDIAWWERKQKKEVVQEAIAFYLATKKDVPERKK